MRGDDGNSHMSWGSQLGYEMVRMQLPAVLLLFNITALDHKFNLTLFTSNYVIFM